MPAVKKKNTPVGQKRCGCINHDIFVDDAADNSSCLFRGRSFFENRLEFKELLRRELVPPRVTFICTICLAFARGKILAEKQRSSSNNDKSGNSNNGNNIIGDNDDDGNDGSAVNDTDQSTILNHDGDVNDDNVNDDIMYVNDVDVNQNNSYNNNNNDNNNNNNNDDDDDDDDNTEDGNITALLENVKGVKNYLVGKKWLDLHSSVKEAVSDLAYTLGALIRSDLDNERFQMAKDCRSFDSLISIKPHDWYEDRNKLLTRFLHGCTGVSGQTTKEKKFNSCLHAIEQIIYTKNNNIVTPFALKRNIIMYSISKSKLSSTILGCWESSGSYTKVNEILNSPSEPLSISPEGDIVITFDNEQKVGKHSGRIREASKQPISIITTVAVIQPNPLTSHQFLPYNRLGLKSANVIAKINEIEQFYHTIMQTYRFHFISEIIEEVVEEQFADEIDVNFLDYVDLAVMSNGIYVCSCKYMHRTRFDICPSCNENTSCFPHNFDKYFHTASHHTTKPCISHAEPCLVNPNGIVNVTEVLTQITNHGVISPGREWVTVTCDGLPYTHASEIQDEMIECLTCHDILPKDEESTHKEIHKCEVKFERPFSKLLIRPGLGHIEMNMSKKLLSFLWTPLINDISGLFGFRTQKAKEVLKAGADHHRSRQLLETLLFSLSKELIVPYVRYCINVESIPSCSGYKEWFDKQVTSQSYVFWYHAIFSYLLPFHLFNESVRKDNSENMMAARTTFHPLFFHHHHPMYKKLHLRDMIERVNYPENVASYFQLTESFTKSGKKNGGQGADFIHEEVNRDIKSFLPKSGVPSKANWVNIIRKIETLKEMRKSLLLNNSDQESGKKRPNKYHHEITMVRREIRKDSYLLNYTSDESITSVGGEPLDHSLCDFNSVLKQNYAEYKEEYKLSGSFGARKPNPVFITPDERDEFAKIENKTIEEIKVKITEIANAMLDQDIASNVRQQVLSKKKKLKHEYIALYKVCEKLLDEQLAVMDQQQDGVQNDREKDDNDDDINEENI